MKKAVAALLFLSAIVSNVPAVLADTTATTVLSGGVSLRANYNIQKTEDDTDEGWGSSGRANLGLVHTRRSKDGALSLNYGQTFSYNFRTGESSLGDDDLRISLNTWRNLSSRLRFNLSDTFTRTIDLWAENLSPTATGIPAEPLDGDDGDTVVDGSDTDKPTLSEKIGENKFWTNHFSTGLNYQYAKRGSLSLGYNNTILEYDESDLNNYKRNRGSIGISQGLAPRWSTGLTYSYTDATFDLTEDFTTHNAGVTLGYTHSVRDSFSAGVNYFEKNYDMIDPADPQTLNNSYIISGNLGWTHNFSPRKTLSSSAGVSFYHKDDGNDETSPNFSVYYTSQFERGSWFVGAEGGYTDRSFEGVLEDQGISEHQTIRTGVSWQVAEYVNAGLGASVRNDDYLENPITSEGKTYSAYANISYRFLRWFYLSGRYFYLKTDAAADASDKEEHRFFITLGASRELYRWIHGR